ncbi:MAG: glycosyltransferase family 39 protein [Candidatus Omnitrophica bacterium]|nr:glycosyltransferase family 39 protein [Candidatus Omnitrophota bacterium]
MIFLVLLACAALNLLTLKDGHNWGGDFGQYIIHAQNLLNHNNYSQGIMLEKAIIYPPGFPLMIAPIIKLFGLNFPLLKSINVLFWCASLLLLYLLFKNPLGRNNALLGISVLAASSFFFVFKQNVLSDVPFTFLTIACIYALQRGHFIAALLLIFYAVLTRSAGWALGGAVMLYFLFLKRDLRVGCGVFLAAASATAVQTFCSGGMRPAFWHAFLASPLETAQRLWQGSPIVWQSLIWFFCPGQTMFTSWIFTAIEYVAIVLSPLIYLALIVLFIRKLRTKDLPLVECFCFIYGGLLLVWSSFGDFPQNFTRFTLPIAGFLLMLGIRYAQRSNWMKWALAFLLIFNLANIIAIYRFNDDEILREGPNKELFLWIKENLGPDEHYMMWEPRTAALMTGRVGTTVAWLKFNPENQWENILRQMKARYLILNPWADRNLIERLTKRLPSAKNVWQNAGYVIFDYTPAKRSSLLGGPLMPTNG